MNITLLHIGIRALMDPRIRKLSIVARTNMPSYLSIITKQS